MTNPVRRNVLVAAAAALLAVGIAGCGGATEEATAKPAPEEVTKQAAPEEVTEVAAPGLGLKVQEGIAAGFPGGITASSPLFAITQYEDVSSGTVRVYVQENLDDAGRNEIAKQVINMSGIPAAELSTVVVRDASGVDSNHYR